MLKARKGSFFISFYQRGGEGATPFSCVSTIWTQLLNWYTSTRPVAAVKIKHAIHYTTGQLTQLIMGVFDPCMRGEYPPPPPPHTHTLYFQNRLGVLHKTWWSYRAICYVILWWRHCQKQLYHFCQNKYFRGKHFLEAKVITKYHVNVCK